MSLRVQLDRVRAFILNNQIEAAVALLAQLVPVTDVEKRILIHYQGILDIQRGQFASAKTKMQGALDRYGANVNLLRDLIVCQYHLQDMLGFRENLARLEQSLIELEPVLENDSLTACELMVGKFLEEEARLVPALAFYERALKRATHPAHRLRALIQKSRWHALYQPAPAMSLFYRELISVRPETLSYDLQIELEHSLMLIELRLIGSDHAWERIERLNGRVSVLDQRLMVFDFIEGVLAQELELADAVIKKMNEFEGLDPYEEFLRKAVKDSLEPASLIRELTLLASQLPWASYLRLLCIAANREGSNAVRQELRRKIQLIVYALDVRSQEIWSKRLKLNLANPDIRIGFSKHRRELDIQGVTVDLSKRRNGFQLLETLLEQPVLAVDEAIHILWRSSFTPEHYHRLRMSVHRLNSLVHQAAGIGKIVEIDSQHVRLRPEVRMKGTVEASYAEKAMTFV